MGNGTLENVFFLLGGMAVMLYGMHVMGLNLEKVAGNNLKRLLGKMTSNRFAGVGVGAAVTSIIQSSAATTVMLVGFVNIGLMSLTQATSVIMGANIGTTITAQILSLTGVGFDVSAYAAVLAALGAILALFVKNEKANNVGHIFIGIGMIFIGLEIMSISIDKLIYEQVEGRKQLKHLFGVIFQGDHFPLVLVLIGIVFTALIQSSSAVTGILVALSGALKFQNAVFIILGSNIGTCITALLSSIGTSTNAKRTAVIHLLFNTIGCLVVIAPLWVWGDFFHNFIVMISGTSPERQIANFHTIFNVFTTIILLPFTRGLCWLATKIVRDKPDGTQNLLRFTFIDPRFLSTPPVAVDSTKKEIVRMAELARKNLSISMDAVIDCKTPGSEFETNERVLNFLNRGITAYLTELSSKTLTYSDEKRVGSYYHVVTDLERVGDYAENIVEYYQKLVSSGQEFSSEAKAELREMTEAVMNMLDIASAAFSTRDLALVAKVTELEETVDEMSVSFENRHIARLKEKSCSAEVGSLYLQTVSNLERVGDHIYNFASSIRQYIK